MTVYVDTLSPCKPNRNWKWREACHLFATTLAELHEFAESIGLKRSWFQGGGHLSHYDLTKGKRSLAVARGAVEVGLIEMVREIWPTCEGYKGRRRPDERHQGSRVDDGDDHRDAGDVSGGT